MVEGAADTPDRPHHLGVNVYLSDPELQSELVTRCLAPAAARMHGENGGARFWFTRFDARGPHVLALFTPPRGADGGTAEATDAAEARLRGALEDHLRDLPSPAPPPADEVRRRHQECRGKALCEADRLPGLAAEGSYLPFRHPADGYPYHLGRDLEDPAALHRQMGEVCRWVVDHLREGSAGAALASWMTRLDLHLAERSLARDYWALHAATLLPALRDAPPQGDEERVATLRAALGDGNRRQLARHWREAASDGPAPPPVAALVDTVVGGSGPKGRDPARVAATLREITHCSLIQLGHPVRSHLPWVLYGWLRSLRDPGGDTA